jgi:hypothetical protein
MFATAAVVMSLAGALIAAEASIRVVRGAPHPTLDIVIEPGGKTQAPDPVLGFRPLPGTYTVVFDHRDRWQITNLRDSTRITRPLHTYDGSPRGGGIWVFGCSFVQGWGIDDADTFSWKLQEQFPGHDVVNFGVGGYGTLQSWLQLRQALGERPAPVAVILAYAEFHDERNTRGNNWRDANFDYAPLGTTAQPFARFDASGRLRIEWSNDVVPLMPLRSRSALIDLAVDEYNLLHDRSLRSHEVSELLIEKFAQESRRHGARFILAAIDSSPVARATLGRFADQGIPAIDISVNLRDPAYGIPYDGHPNAAANERYADGLAALLRNAGIVS